MHITRFVDAEGRIRLGMPFEEGRALAIEGDICGEYRVTQERLEIIRRLAPITPVNIFCIGLNYRDHARETGAPIPEQPVLFMKPTTAVSNPADPIRIPLACEHGPELDYEAELAVIIGRECRDVPASRALDKVLGYTCANDVSARRWQKRGGGDQWIRGKGFDGFCPLGPVLVTADEIPDPQSLSIQCSVGGLQLQTGSTGDMIFPVAEIIAFLSRDTTLLPSTLILTGTPAGVGFTRKPPRFLVPGDLVTVEIDQIGVLENPVTGPA